MFWARRLTYLLAFVLCVSIIAWAGPRLLDPTTRGPAKRARDRLWVESSPYWLDRQTCRWLGLCGIHHLRRDPAARGESGDWREHEEWGELKRRALNWNDGAEEAPRWKADKKRNVQERRRILKDVPSYVLDHAPLVHLYSGEEFWPSDIREHVGHMTPYIDLEPVNDTGVEWNLNNLHKLNKKGWAVLRSKDDVESRPEWLHSHHNIPNPVPEDPENETPPRMVGDGERLLHRPERTNWYDVDKSHPLHRISDPRLRNRPLKNPPGSPRLLSRGHKPDANGYSKAPAILIVVDKGSGIVDAFWFFFYSYNLGQTVLGIRFGNHVGDWEHCAVRFEHGVPRGVFFSEHEGGQAHAWEAVEKRGNRPVVYSAVGSHAMYPLPGLHPYVLPFRMLRDVTDKGPIWDPALNNYAYHYDPSLEAYAHDSGDDAGDEDDQPRSLIPATSNPDAPTSWFHFRGFWGDEVYSLADPRQWRFFGQYHYVTGPDGPKSKNLNRSFLCQSRWKCHVLYELDPKGTWY